LAGINISDFGVPVDASAQLRTVGIDRMKVLIVDSEYHTRKVIRALLLGMGCTRIQTGVTRRFAESHAGCAEQACRPAKQRRASRAKKARELNPASRRSNGVPGDKRSRYAIACARALRERSNQVPPISSSYSDCSKLVKELEIEKRH